MGHIYCWVGLDPQKVFMIGIRNHILMPYLRVRDIGVRMTSYWLIQGVKRFARRVGAKMIYATDPIGKMPQILLRNGFVKYRMPSRETGDLGNMTAGYGTCNCYGIEVTDLLSFRMLQECFPYLLLQILEDVNDDVYDNNQIPHILLPSNDEFMWLLRDHIGISYDEAKDLIQTDPVFADMMRKLFENHVVISSDGDVVQTTHSRAHITEQEVTPLKAGAEPLTREAKTKVGSMMLYTLNGIMLPDGWTADDIKL